MAWTRRWLLGVCITCALATSAPPQTRFLSYTEAQEILAAFGRTEEPSAWDQWVRTEDREMRRRVDRGFEDSISNLILYGISFTRLPRLESADAAVTATGELVEAARARVRAFAAALAHPQANERLRFAREYLSRQGVQPRGVEAFLAANLTRYVMEQRAYQEKLRLASETGDGSQMLFARATLFESRGLSVDTSLLPNYALEETLRVMVRKHALDPAHIRNIAVIGPGLDFSDKRDGYDFYPVQTIQPFAVLEAVVRLGVGDAGGLRLITLDLNPAVNAHVRQTVERARAGTRYVLHLPHDPAADWTPQIVAYWKHFGELIGSPIDSVRAPEGVTVRAISVQPKYLSRIQARDLDVVGQILEGEQFDLVVATNILVYYDQFRQALAMACIAQMMSSGGVFLSNTVLPARRPDTLEYLGRRSVSYSVSGSYGDDVVAYRRR